VAGALGHEDALGTLVGPTRARFLRRVLAVVDPYLHEVFPSAGQEALSTLPKLPDSYPSVIAARSIASALGVSSLTLLRGPQRDGVGLLSNPRAAVLGTEDLAEGAQGRVLFSTAQIAARVAAGSLAGAVLRTDQVQALLDVATDPNVDGPGYRELRKKLLSALPRRSRKELEKVVEEGGGDVRREWALWDDEERRRALRAGVVSCRDLRVVAAIMAPEALSTASVEERRRALAASAPMVDALRFAASDGCWSAHRKVFGQS
jgi:hypothetical protein